MSTAAAPRASLTIVFLGTGDFGVPTFHALRSAGHVIACAVSQPDRPAGRGLKLSPTAIHTIADQTGTPHVQAADVNAPEVLKLVSGADLGVVVAFGQKIGGALLATPRLGMINLHGSLLPRYRGAAPYQWALINGDARTGVTVFQLNQRWDDGPIWACAETEILETETADELHDRLALLGANVVLAAMQRITRNEQPTPQDLARATRAPKLSRSDGQIDFDQSASQLARRIHGLWSWPAAVCLLRTQAGRMETLQIARVRAIDAPAPEASSTPCGTLRADLTVQCAAGALQLLEVKPAGGKLMPFDAYARGRRLQPGDRCTRVTS